MRAGVPAGHGVEERHAAGVVRVEHGTHRPAAEANGIQEIGAVDVAQLPRHLAARMAIRPDQEA